MTIECDAVLESDPQAEDDKYVITEFDICEAAYADLVQTFLWSGTE